jgi:hypothetical protein
VPAVSVAGQGRGVLRCGSPQTRSRFELGFSLDETSVIHWGAMVKGQIVDPGTIDIRVVGSSAAIQLGEVIIGGAPRPAPGYKVSSRRS